MEYYGIIHQQTLFANVWNSQRNISFNSGVSVVNLVIVRGSSHRHLGILLNKVKKK
jgi:hypothetical protein